MHIMWPAHSSTIETLFHPSSLRLIKYSSVRFVDPSSHANERFNLQLVSFSIQNESHHLASFLEVVVEGKNPPPQPHPPHTDTHTHFKPSSLLEERRSPPLFSLCNGSLVEDLFSLQGGNVLIPAGMRRWCYCGGEDCFYFQEP